MPSLDLLSDDIHDYELNIEGYNFIRHDRKDRLGGGVAVYITETITNSIEYMSNGQTEILTIILNKQYNLRISTIYRHPWIHDFNEFEQLFITHHKSKHIIIGDINDNPQSNQANSSQIAGQHGYVQLIKDYTRYDSETLLDHIYINNQNLV